MYVVWRYTPNYFETTCIITSRSADAFIIPELSDKVAKNDKEKAINDIVDAVFSSPCPTIVFIQVPDELATDPYHKLLEKIKEKNQIYKKFIVLHDRENDKLTLTICHD